MCGNKHYDGVGGDGHLRSCHSFRNYECSWYPFSDIAKEWIYSFSTELINGRFQLHIVVQGKEKSVLVLVKKFNENTQFFNVGKFKVSICKYIGKHGK